MIKYSCKCGTQLSAPEIQAGAKIRCYSCQEQVMVPAKSTVAEPTAAEKTKVNCPECKQDYSFTQCGPSGGCPHCGWNSDRMVRMCMKCGSPLVLPGANKETNFNQYTVPAVLAAIGGAAMVFGGPLRFLILMGISLVLTAFLGGLGIRVLLNMAKSFVCLNCNTKPRFLGASEKKRVANFHSDSRMAAFIALGLAAFVAVMAGSMFLYSIE